jgi:hypothetical protein
MDNKTWVTNITEDCAEGYCRNGEGLLVGEPQPTPLHDAEELTQIGLVGIYQVKKG